MSLFSLAACGGHRANKATPVDPFAQIGVIPLSLGELAGANVLVLTTGMIVIGDSTEPLPEIDVRRTALLAFANIALDSALRRDAREVTWLSVEVQRRAARRNPTLGIEPDHFATQYLFNPNVTRIPDPLWSQLRSLAAVSSARYVLAPAAVKLSGTAGALTASYVMVLADARSGSVLMRTRAVGHAAATPEAALTLAAGSVVVTTLH
jgi:hypothetical protein